MRHFFLSFALNSRKTCHVKQNCTMLVLSFTLCIWLRGIKHMLSGRFAIQCAQKHNEFKFTKTHSPVSSSLSRKIKLTFIKNNEGCLRSQFSHIVRSGTRTNYTLLHFPCEMHIRCGFPKQSFFNFLNASQFTSTLFREGETIGCSWNLFKPSELFFVKDWTIFNFDSGLILLHIWKLRTF